MTTVTNEGLFVSNHLVVISSDFWGLQMQLIFRLDYEIPGITYALAI